MRTVTKSLIALSALALGSLAFAGPHGGPHHGPKGPGHALIKVVKELDLSTEQETQIRAILEEAREERRAERDGRKAEMDVFKAEILSDTPNVKKLHRMVDENAAERTARMHDRIDDMLAISAILTPEQRVEAGERLDEMRERMEARMSERRKRFED